MHATKMDVKDWSYNALKSIVKLNNIIGYLPVSLENVLEAVMAEVQRLYNPLMCCIHMVDEDGKMQLVAYKSKKSSSPDLHLHDSAEYCPSLRDGLPYISEEDNLCPNRRTEEGGPFYQICIPLITGKEQYGTISCQRKTPLDYEEMDVLLAIANQVSMAIQRSQLFEKLKKEKDEIYMAYKKIHSLNMQLQEKIKQLQEANKRLIQAERIAAVGRMAASLSHELNNPMSIILNRIECMRIEGYDRCMTDSIKKDIDVIYAYASKVSSIVQDMLMFSRSSPERFSPIDITEIIRAAITFYMEEISKAGCEVIFDPTKRVPLINGDPERLEMLFQNLIRNAIDAMPDGGRVFINYSENKNSIEITIRDEGVGIEPSLMERIFEPFFTTKKPGKGTGLGLTICYSIVKEHGGEIAVESTPGQGTIFKLTFPVYENE